MSNIEYKVCIVRTCIYTVPMSLNLEKAIKNESRYFIAEIGLNHNGEVSKAKSLIDVAARNQLQAVKFQKRDISQLATAEVLNSSDFRFPLFGNTYGEIRKNLEFNIDELRELQSYALNLGLDFFVTPFDIKSLELLDQLQLEIIKVASHSVTNLDLLIEIASRNKFTILSSGMCSIDELDEAVKIISSSSLPTILLHCVSSYPLDHDRANLNLIDTFRNRYKLPIGYSGHEIDFYPTVIAYSKGARIIERHITLKKDDMGFDHKLSLTEEEIVSLNNELDKVDSVLGNGVKKLETYEEITRNKYRVSMVSARKILKDSFLCLEDITWKNPGTGIPRSGLSKFLGQVLIRDIEPDTLIRVEDFYEVEK